MIEVGRLCMKIAGRDAGLQCVVVDVLDKNFVLIDGQTRRRKCNIMHLEPSDKLLKVSKGATHDAVVKLFKDLGMELVAKKSKAKAPVQATAARAAPHSKAAAPKVKKAPAKAEKKAE